MSAATNKDVVKRFVSCLCAGKLDDAAKLYTRDSKYWILGFGNLDMESVKAFWAQGFSTAPGPDALKIVELTADDNRVTAEMVGNIKMPDGRVFQNQYHNLYVFRDGLIAETKEYMDTAYTQKFFGTNH